MYKLLRNISGMLLAAALTLLLNGKAWAADEELSALPAEAPTEIIESLPEQSVQQMDATSLEKASVEETPAEEKPADTVDPSPAELPVLPEASELTTAELAEIPSAEEPEQLISAAEESAFVTGEAETSASPALSASEPADSDDAGPTEPKLTVSGTTVDLSSPEDTAGEGWRYDAEDGSLILINCSAADRISTSGSSVTIKAAGVNRISTLTVDGDINVIGTGVLLVDSIEMPEGCSFNLFPNREIYGESGGSVAVFLKQVDPETGEVSYQLINGDVDGILDEEYVLPENVNLVLPDHSRLVLQNVATLIETQTDEETEEESTEVHYSLDSELKPQNTDSQVEKAKSIAKLRVPQTSRLTVQKLAEITLTALKGLHGGSEKAELIVDGELQLDGTVEGGEILLNRESAVSGDGVFEKSQLILAADQNELNVTDSVLILQGNDISALRVDGSSTLVSSGGSIIAGTDLKEGAELSIRSFNGSENGDSLRLGVVTGSGLLRIVSGDVEISDGSKSAVDVETLGMVLSQTESGKSLTETAGPDGAVTISPQTEKQVTDTGYLIPVISVFCRETKYADQIDGVVDDIKASEQTALPDHYEIAASTEETTSILDWDDLAKKLMPQTQNADGNYTVARAFIEVYYGAEDGSIQCLRLAAGESRNEEISAESICLIRTVELFEVTNGIGGGVAATTTLSYTGSGQLGRNAGSVQGGSKNVVLLGSGIKTPAEEEPADPDPDPDPTPAPIPAPDPVVPDDSGNGGESSMQLHAWVEPAEDGRGFILCATFNGREMTVLFGKIPVRMAYTLSEDQRDKPIYVVFRRADGKLVAVSADYDDQSGTISFETNCLGRFVVVAFDYEGEAFSAGFYEALAELPAVQELP